jgi:hypothetical protein
LRAVIAAVEYAPGELGETYYKHDNPTAAFSLIRLAIAARGNFDALALRLLDHCRERGGHNSVVLKLLEATQQLANEERS